MTEKSSRYRRTLNIRPTKEIPVASTVSDAAIARKYISKMDECIKRDIPFCLPLISFINISKAKKCFYTGLPLTAKTLTIDRIDANLGYERGNVVACHTTFNSFKAIVENEQNPLVLSNALKGLTKFHKAMTAKGE